MSGGYFDYDQHRLSEIVTKILLLKKNNGIPDRYGYARTYGEKTLEMFTEIAESTLLVNKLLDAVDLLASEDIGEECFNDTIKGIWNIICSEGLAEEVEKLYKALDD